MAPHPRELITELSRRRVFRVAGAYIAGGLVVIYAGDAILPRLGMEWAQVLLVVLILLGFPLAIALSWAFDVTPEGVRRAKPGGAPVSSPGERSIVVLPFDNMSPDPQDGYLGDGLTEEITSKLSKLRSLRVISRTSAIQLKRSDKDLGTIARDLDVQYVLEGSVRKSGEALRITAQLIDAPRDHHLWSESYDGRIEDVFGMQEQVSRAIVGALRLKLSPDETRLLEERPFDSLQAYQFYAQARAGALLAGEESLERALKVTDVGLATVGENELLLVARGLALFQLVNSLLKDAALHEGFIDEADDCALRALALNPRLAPARALNGFVLHARGDIVGAATQFAEALKLDPNNPEALLIMGYYRAAGGWDPSGARAHLLKLERIDPLTPLNTGALGWVHWFDGDFTGALERFRPWWDAMDAGNPWLIVRAYLQAAAGDMPGATATIELMQEHAPEHLLSALGSFLAHSWRGERSPALAAVTTDLETAARWDDVWPMYLAAGYSSLNELDRAFHWLDHAVSHGVTNVDYLGRHDPFLSGMRDDRRFPAILSKAADLCKAVEEAVLAVTHGA